MMIFCRSWYALPEPDKLAARAVEGIADERYRLYSEAEIAAQWRAAGAEVVAYESYEPTFQPHRVCFAKA